MAGIKLDGTCSTVEFFQEYFKEARRQGIAELISDNWHDKKPENGFSIHIMDYELMVGQKFEYKEYPRVRFWYDKHNDRAGIETGIDSARSIASSVTFIKKFMQLIENKKIDLDKLKEVLDNNHKSEEKIPEINKV